MLNDDTHDNIDGFSVLELVIIMLFVGILAAISAPSFLALNRNNQLTNDLANAKSAVIEAQRDAIRLGKTCTISLSTDTPPVILSSTANCLSTGTRTLNNVSMQLSTNNTSLASTSTDYRFNYLGEGVAVNSSGVEIPSSFTTIVLQHNSTYGEKKCIVIAQPLGLIATGKYTGSTANIASNCTP
jgi:Tfp pilus assembly protein FimT